mmetsp:Transcript_4723/g.10091  ORF Transcript_4723/g.10091 Transcript_4723/m.10091 type:complete len:305 (-) Transcript_4723:51-965(-)
MELISNFWSQVRLLERDLSVGIDGAPIRITQVQHLTPHGFPVETIEEQFLGWTLHPYTPLIGVVLYLTLKPILSFAFDAALGADRGKRPSGNLVRGLVFFHNVLLCVFSAWVWFRTWHLVYSSIQAVGFMDTYCETERSILMSSGLALYITLFYLSKYYEFMDTLILIIKGKQVSLLQTYHHSGAVFAMWMLAAARAPSALIFLGLNGMIHTVMYAYYAASSLGYTSRLKKYITTMQITQFFAGEIAAFVPTANIVPNCLNPAGRFASFFSMIYVVPLVLLFAQFYASSYLSKRASRSSATKSE